MRLGMSNPPGPLPASRGGRGHAVLAGGLGSREHRSMLRASSGLFWLALGCNQSPGATPAAEPAPAQGAATASRAPAPSASAASECVESCVAGRQMQAVSPQQIEADCRAECEK